MTDNTSLDPRAAGQGDDIPSPCVSVCTIHPDTGWCLGCFRTLDEIALWPQFSVDDKRAVLALLPARGGRQALP